MARLMSVMRTQQGATRSFSRTGPKSHADGGERSGEAVPARKFQSGAQNRTAVSLAAGTTPPGRTATATPRPASSLGAKRRGVRVGAAPLIAHAANLCYNHQKPTPTLRRASFLFWPIAILLLSSGGTVYAQTAESHSFMLIGGMDGGAAGPDLVSPSYRIESAFLGQSPITWTIGKESSSAAAQPSPVLPSVSASIAIPSKPVGLKSKNRKIVIEPAVLKKPTPMPASVPRPPTVSQKTAEKYAIISAPKPSPPARIRARAPTRFSIRRVRKPATTISRIAPIQPQHIQTAGEPVGSPGTYSEKSSWSLASLLSWTPSGFLGGNDGMEPWLIFTAAAFAAGVGVPRLSAMASLVPGFLQKTRPIRQRGRRMKA
jgi:hypothetical protein